MVWKLEFDAHSVLGERPVLQSGHRVWFLTFLSLAFPARMPRRFEPLDEAKKDDWIVISMKNDWRRIFAFE